MISSLMNICDIVIVDAARYLSHVWYIDLCVLCSLHWIVLICSFEYHWHKRICMPEGGNKGRDK